MNKRVAQKTKGFDKRKELKNKKPNRCKSCGGSVNGDDYFIPRCLCMDFEIMEGNDFEPEDL